MKDGSLLIIFTKNPEPGLVKTRLAASIGNEKALEVYETLRGHTALIAEQVAVNRTVFFSHFLPASDIFFTADFNVDLQVGHDLGERMLHAIRRGFQQGFKHIVLIGTDCYVLSTAIIESAFTALDHSDAVVGPARDGGFYLVGLNKLLPELFLRRQWSTSEVLTETTNILRNLGITYMLLPLLSDIDTFDDLKQSKLWRENE